MLNNHLRGPNKLSHARRTFAVLAAFSALATSVPAGTYTWVGGNSGDPTNFNDAANWSPNTAAPGSADIAYFNLSTANQPGVTASASLGELDFNTSGWRLSGAGNTLSLNFVGGVGILSAASNGLNEISVSLDVAAAQTWDVATGGTLQIDGVISDGNALTIGSAGYAGTTIFTAANSFSGSLTVAAGTLELAGATIGGSPQTGALQSVSTIILNGGSTFTINNTSAAGGNANNRLNSSATLQLWGGNFVYDGADASGTSSTDGVSSTTINAGPVSTITVTPSGGNAASLNLGSLNRSSNTGVLFVNGVGLGTTGGQLLLNSLPETIGNTPGTGSDAAGTYDTQIVPFLVGESGTASGAGGTAAGTPNTFVTVYQTPSGTYSLRPLNPTDEYVQNSILAGANTYITSATPVTATNSINSLVINGGDLSINDGATLTVNSGALLFVTPNSIKPTGSTGILDFSSNEGIITVNPGVTANISAPITSGGNGITENGAGILTLTTSSSNVSGSLNINGTVQFGNGANTSADAIISNSSTNVNIDQDAVLVFDDVGPQTINFPINFFNNNLTEGATYGIATLLINGPGPLTFNNVITRQNAGSAYFESQSLAPVTFSGSFNVTNLRFYESGANQAGVPIGSFSDPVVWSVANGGSIGTASNPAATLYWSNNNFGTGITPSPVVSNVASTGSIYANSLYLGYNGGAITTNVNGPITLNQVNSSGGSLFSAYNAGVANNNSTIYGNINIGAGGSISAYSAYLAYSSGQYSYLDVSNGGQFTIQNTANSASSTYALYLANLGDGLIEVGTVNGSGSTESAINFGVNSTNPGTTTTPPPIIVNGGTTSAGAHIASEFSEINLYAGGSLNIGDPDGGSGGGSGGAGGLQAGYAAGQIFVLNVYGGTLDNLSGNSPIYVNQNLTAGYGAYSIVNVDSDANGNVGKLITGYLRALPNPTAGSTTAVGVTSAFLNFDGGEVEYNNISSSGAVSGGQTQASFPNNGWVGGVFVFSKGAIFGTNALGSSVSGGNNNIDHPFLAPLGDGVTSIPISNGGSGYLSPPLVQISDASGDTTGVDAAAVATLTNGVLTGITITSPGINYTLPPTITLIGGDPTSAATLGTATIAANSTTGGLTKVDNGTLTLAGGYWYPTPGQTAGPYVADDTVAQNTYGGPTTVEAGTLALNGVYNATNGIVIETNNSADAATLQINQVTSLNGTSVTQVNNNIPDASTIVVGDQPANATLTNVGTLQITATGKSGFSGFALNADQVLAGFGIVKGTSTYGLNIGQAAAGATAGAINSQANPTPATPAALTGTDSVIAPGYTASGSALVLLNNTAQYQPNNPLYGPVVVGTVGNGTPTFTFNTRQGNAAALSAPSATGALTLGNGSGTTTSLGGAGTYYWKLDLTNGGAGATSTPGTATVSPGLTSGAPGAGAAWDQLILDNVSVNNTFGTTSSGTSNAFTIEATSFSSGTTVSGGSPVATNGATMGTTSYSWVIARVNQSYSATAGQALLANLSLDVSGLPKTASGYEYFLSTQADPAASDTDLVISYAPVPEPTGLVLIGLATGGVALRRRRVR